MGTVLLATIAGALLMFVSDHDAVIVAVITAFAGLLAIRAAGLLAAGVGEDIARVRAALAAVADGHRDRRLRLAGNDELAELARETDAMVERLAAAGGARNPLRPGPPRSRRGGLARPAEPRSRRCG